MKYLIFLIPHLAFSSESSPNIQTNLNVVWVVVAASFVFLMQAGFAAVEIGLTRSKNALNIIMKNLMDFSVGSIVFYLIGFGLMFGQTNGIFGSPFGIYDFKNGESWTYTFLIFQSRYVSV